MCSGLFLFSSTVCFTQLLLVSCQYLLFKTLAGLQSVIIDVWVDITHKKAIYFLGCCLWICLYVAFCVDQDKTHSGFHFLVRRFSF